MGNSYLLHQERCPKCAERGQDNKGDNLAVYNDGHVYCFSCGYNYGGNGFSSFHVKQHVKEHKVSLPNDSDINYSIKSIQWIEKYHLTKEDLLRNNVLFSEKGVNFKRKGNFYTADNVLIFPVWGQDEQLLAYQARYFGDNKDIPKWIGRGDMKEVYNILEGSDKKIVLVEDIVSAIRVQQAGYTSMPVYGNNVKNRFKRLYTLGYKDIIIWLDPNMYSEMIRQGRYAYGCNIHIIFSGKDPKEYTNEEIKGFING